MKAIQQFNLTRVYISDRASSTEHDKRDELFVIPVVTGSGRKSYTTYSLLKPI